MSLKIVGNSPEGRKHGCNVSNVICHGDFIVTGSDDGKIKIWKPDLEFVSEMVAPAGILSMAACDNVLYTCSTDETIQSWDLTTGKNSGSLSSTLSQPLKLFVDRSTKTLWAGDREGFVAKFEGGKETVKFELIEEPWDLMVLGNLVYTARDRDVVVGELKLGSHKAVVIVHATHSGRGPCCIAGNRFCFLNREGRNINVHEIDSRKTYPRLKEIVASELILNALAAAGETSLFSGGYDCTVKKWDLNSFNCTGSVNLGCCINALASRSEKEVYVARSDGMVTKLEG